MGGAVALGTPLRRRNAIRLDLPEERSLSRAPHTGDMGRPWPSGSMECPIDAGSPARFVDPASAPIIAPAVLKRDAAP